MAVKCIGWETVHHGGISEMSSDSADNTINAGRRVWLWSASSRRLQSLCVVWVHDRHHGLCVQECKSASGCREIKQWTRYSASHWCFYEAWASRCVKATDTLSLSSKALTHDNAFGASDNIDDTVSEPPRKKKKLDAAVVNLRLIHRVHDEEWLSGT